MCSLRNGGRFSAPEVDRVWVGDITYVWTREGWLYLAVLLDTYSRRVVGWSLRDRLDEDLAVRTLRRALAARRPALGLIHHTDRGGPYCGRTYQQLLTHHGLVPSMSRTGDCWDNAMVESFFKTLKVELGERFSTRRAAHQEVFGYIEGFYNTRRLHSGLGYRSPVEFERPGVAWQAAA